MEDKRLFGEAAPSIIEHHDYFSQAVQQAQDLAEAINKDKRAAARRRQYEEWSKPENIALRLEEFVAAAEKARENGEALKKLIRQAQGLPLEDPPLPPLEKLPKEMRGQSESTIRAWLRQQDEPFVPLEGLMRKRESKFGDLK